MCVEDFAKRANSLRSVRRSNYGSGVQDRLFESSAETDAVIDLDHDPYDDLRESAERLTTEYAIDTDTALQAIIAFGSESGARRILRQRWWNGEVELREELEAA
jgi:hypothetical protein